MSTVNISSDRKFGPKNNIEASPTNCIEIRPNKEPERIRPYPIILSLGTVYAIKEAPPNIPAVMPKAAGMIFGPIVLTAKNTGAAETPKPKIPKENKNSRDMGLTTLYLGVMLSIYLMTSGLMRLTPIKEAAENMAPKITVVSALAIKNGMYVAA